MRSKKISAYVNKNGWERNHTANDNNSGVAIMDQKQLRSAGHSPSAYSSGNYGLETCNKVTKAPFGESLLTL